MGLENRFKPNLAPSFEQWWRKLKILAADEGVRLKGIQVEYYDYYMDGDSPNRTLAMILKSSRTRKAYGDQDYG